MFQLEFNDTSLYWNIQDGHSDMNDDVLFPLYPSLWPSAPKEHSKLYKGYNMLLPISDVSPYSSV